MRAGHQVRTRRTPGPARSPLLRRLRGLVQEECAEETRQDAAEDRQHTGTDDNSLGARIALLSRAAIPTWRILLLMEGGASKADVTASWPARRDGWEKFVAFVVFLCGLLFQLVGLFGQVCTNASICRPCRSCCLLSETPTHPHLRAPTLCQSI